MPNQNPRTANRDYPTFVLGNEINFDLPRFAELATKVDVDVSTLFAQMSGKIDATALVGYQLTSQRNQPNGYAGLDSTAKIPLSQIPLALLGFMAFQAMWNAATNTPAIPAASAANKGWFYIVSVDGTTNISGESDWKSGDWIVSVGTSWKKIDNTDRVTAVAGKTGAVTLQVSDLTDYATLLTLAGTQTVTGHKTFGKITLNGKPIGLAKGTTVVSAATTDIFAGDDGNFVDVSGSFNGITSFGAPAAGEFRIVTFTGTPTVTNNANIIVDGGANITMATGQTALAVGNGLGVVRFTPFSRSQGVNIANFETTSVVTALSTETIPFDNTSPLNTEGKQIFTVTLTPRSASSKIRITGNLPFDTSGGAPVVFALFRDNETTPLGAWSSASINGDTFVFEKIITAGSTSAQIFKLRFGSSGAASAWINSDGAGNPIFGGTSVASMTVQEIQV